MTLPARSAGNVVWHPPHADRRVATWGYCADRLLLDSRDLSDARDPMAPPQPGAAWWREATADDILLIPELRGAVQRPEPRPLGTGGVTPCTATGAPLAWGAETGWWAIWHEGLRRPVAFWAPSGSAVGDARLRTNVALPRCAGALISYQVLVPEDTDAGGVPVRTGLSVVLGLDPTTGGAHYWYQMPNPHRADPSSGHWLLRRHGRDAAEVVDWHTADRITAPTAPTGTETETRPEWLLIIPTAGWLALLSSRQPDRWWAYRRDGGCWPRAGQLMVGLRGARGWVDIALLRYATTTTLRGPVAAWPEEVTLAGEARVQALPTPAADGTPGSTFSGTVTVTDTARRLARSAVTITNSSPVLPIEGGGASTTPLIYSLQEVRRTVLAAAPAAPPTIPLAEQVEALSVTHQGGGRGTVARLMLRDWQPGAAGQPPVRGGLLDRLRGVGRVTIELWHQPPGTAPAGPALLVMTGYCGRVTRTWDTGHPMLEIELRDRAWLWAEGRATMADLPDLQGWDLRDAAILVLTHHGVPAGEIFFPADYTSRPVSVPWQPDSIGARQETDTPIDQALDDLCTLAGMRWGVRPDGGIEFWWHPRPLAPAWVLDAANTLPADRVEASVTATVDHADAVAEMVVRGRNRWGAEVEAVQRVTAALDQPESPRYIGRGTRVIRSDFSWLARPDTVAERLARAERASGREVTWTTIGRGLWPEQTVEVRLPESGIPPGTVMEIQSVTRSWSAVDPTWRDEYQCRLVAAP